MPEASRAQTAAAGGRPIDYRRNGIRFQIMASIKAAPDFARRVNDKSRANLDVRLRISAHATESNYFGVNSVSFSGTPLRGGSSEELFWQDDHCHQRRGLPKVTVTAIDGFIQNDGDRVDVSARPRQLGKLVPVDEISAGRRLPGGSDKGGPFLVSLSQTNTSRTAVYVKIYTLDCALGATP